MVSTSNSRPTSSTEWWNMDSVTFAESRLSLLAAGNRAERVAAVSRKQLITRQNLSARRQGDAARTACCASKRASQWEGSTCTPWLERKWTTRLAPGQLVAEDTIPLQKQYEPCPARLSSPEIVCKDTGTPLDTQVFKCLFSGLTFRGSCDGSCGAEAEKAANEHHPPLQQPRPHAGVGSCHCTEWNVGKLLSVQPDCVSLGMSSLAHVQGPSTWLLKLRLRSEGFLHPPPTDWHPPAVSLWLTHSFYIPAPSFDASMCAEHSLAISMSKPSGAALEMRESCDPDRGMQVNLEPGLKLPET